MPRGALLGSGLTRKGLRAARRFERESMSSDAVGLAIVIGFILLVFCVGIPLIVCCSRWK